MLLQLFGAKLEDIKMMSEYSDYFNQPMSEPEDKSINPDALEDLANLQFEKNFKGKK